MGVYFVKHKSIHQCHQDAGEKNPLIASRAFRKRQDYFAKITLKFLDKLLNFSYGLQSDDHSLTGQHFYKKQGVFGAMWYSLRLWSQIIQTYSH